MNTLKLSTKISKCVLSNSVKKLHGIRPTIFHRVSLYHELRRNVTNANIGKIGLAVNLQSCINYFHSTSFKCNSDEKDLSEENCVFYDDFKSAVEEDRFQLIDVRRQDEVDAGRIPAKRFLHIPVQDLVEALSKMTDDEFEDAYGMPRPDKNSSDIVFYCKIGIRSSNAIKIASDAGYTKTRHYPGGWSEWFEKVK